MNIQRFSEICHVSVYTLRYYEKIGLLKQIQRNSSGHRDFTQADLAWIEFIKRLKDTGMPLKDIKIYASLRDKGESTHLPRLKLLQQHTANLQARIAAETEHLQKLQEKIEYYQDLQKG
ncbi:MerR family transcriptional regulator [Neptunicella sp. SCSIO 80796]|uniref:MerR family transcriptional regulator n=1 Tax=Neptunicella plasticusilytica TaxID=3117012 RepID=UPI003A4E2049